MIRKDEPTESSCPVAAPGSDEIMRLCSARMGARAALARNPHRRLTLVQNKN